jgi:hypothetical protein
VINECPGVDHGEHHSRCNAAIASMTR